MNYYHKRKITCLTVGMFFVFSGIALSQPISQAGLQPTVSTAMGEISEIIIPASAKMQNNNNLYYEVHLLRNDFPSPSFWYKIIFKEDCFFEFTLFPLMEDDGYDFYFFKSIMNLEFCKAVKEEKLVSCNAARIYKQYTDTEQSEKFRSKLVNIKALPVKARDAIYIEVFSTVGNDCGHILDFRTSSTSFVVKVINDKCGGVKTGDANFQGKYKPVFTEKEAINIFSNTVCHLSNNPVIVSSIKANPKNVSIQKKLDFAAYSLAEAYKYPQPIDTVKIVPKVLEAPKVLVIVDTQKTNTVVKSTADLNATENEVSQIKHEIVEIKSGKEKNSTRLDIDYVLFSLLKEDLKRRMQSNREQLKEYNYMLKNNPKKEVRTDITASIVEIKLQKAELLNKSKDTKIKLKRIQKRLNENRKKPVETRESVFAKSSDPEDLKKHDLKNPEGNNVPGNPKFPSEIVYKIQIGVYKNPISTDVFKGLTPVFSESFPGGIKYFAGAFTVYKDAQNAKEYIKSMGLTDAFVVAYYNGKRVSVEDARTHENDGH